jgi:hypothetical protein
MHFLSYQIKSQAKIDQIIFKEFYVGFLSAAAI